MKRVSRLFAGGLALLSSTAVGQAKITLAKPDAEFAESFTAITSVRELPDGRVLVADMQDRIVQLLDFATGKLKKVGGIGKGPGEYTVPIGLLPLPNGETLINDIGGQRLLVVDRTGKAGKTLQLPTSNGLLVGMGGILSDAAGNLYFEGQDLAMMGVGKGKPKQDTLTAILRWSRVGTAVDTVGWIARPKMEIEESRSSDGEREAFIAISGPKIFGAEEAWGVMPDGSLIRAIPEPYRLVRYDAKTRKQVIGPVQPYQPIKVTEEEKAAVRKAMKNARPTITVGSTGAEEIDVPLPEFKIPEPKFADTKPPFGNGLNGSSALLVTPEGETWVHRLRPVTDTIPRYDVFDRNGKLIKIVTLPKGGSVIGFGKGTVYVVRTDSDDLNYLQRYKR